MPHLDAPMREEFERVGEDLRSIRAAVEQHRVALERQEDLIKQMLDRSLVREDCNSLAREDCNSLNGCSGPATVPPLVLVSPSAGDDQGLEVKSLEVEMKGFEVEEKDTCTINGNFVQQERERERSVNSDEHVQHRSDKSSRVHRSDGRIFSGFSEAHSAASSRHKSRKSSIESLTTPQQGQAHDEKQPRNHRFLDMSALMDQQSLDEPEYDVARFYHHRGFAQALARNEFFCNLTLFFIFMNAVYIGVDAQWNVQDNILRSEWYFQASEQFFCFFFLFEWLVRFAAFRKKSDCFKDNWFKFDTVLVCLMVIETWGLLMVFLIWETATGGGSQSTVSVGPLRLVRMLRLARMTRLMRALPELMTMIKGMRVAARAVISSLLMLLGMIYVFAIVMYSFLRTEETVKEYFGSVGLAMFTLGMNGTFMDNSSDVLRMLIQLKSWHTFSIFVVFILLSSMTIMNMLIGVLCEVVTAVAKAEKEMSAIAMVKQTLLVMLKALDVDGDDLISCEEIANVINDPNSMKVLRELKVDVTYLLEMLAMAFRDPDACLSIKAVMEMIMSCRGDRPTSLQDLIDSLNLMRFQVLEELSSFEDRVMSHIPTKGGNAKDIKKQKSNLGMLCHQQSLVFSHLVTTIHNVKSRGSGMATLPEGSVRGSSLTDLE